MTLGRPAAVLWLLVVLAAGVHLAAATAHGLPLQSDLMALLPREDRDPAVQQAKDRMTAALSQRVVILVGDNDRSAARAAAGSIEAALQAAGVLLPSGDVPTADSFAQLGRVYFPHRAGLLAAGDRSRLMAGQGGALVTRALSQVFGFAGITSGRLLARDPFLLFPAFLAHLPVPASRLVMDAGAADRR